MHIQIVVEIVLPTMSGNPKTNARRLSSAKSKIVFPPPTNAKRNLSLCLFNVSRSFIEILYHINRAMGRSIRQDNKTTLWRRSFYYAAILAGVAWTATIIATINKVRNVRTAMFCFDNSVNTTLEFAQVESVIRGGAMMTTILMNLIIATWLLVLVQIELCHFLTSFPVFILAFDHSLI